MGPRRPRRQPHRNRPKLDLRKTLFVLPNLITLGSVFCGFNAIRLVAREHPTDEDVYRAAVLLIFAMLFDLMDGRVARMTKTQSAFGLQLDSLADVISFGVAPAFLVYKWVLYRLPVPGLLVSFMYVAAAAVRLARFNVLASSSSGAPSKPGRHILGLPTPPSCGILISLVLANHAAGGLIGRNEYTIVLLCVTIGLSLLMVSNVRFRSFKDLRFDTGTILLVLFVIGSSIFVWQRFRPEFVLIWLLSVYLIIGMVETLRVLAERIARRERGSLPPPGV
ncbi:MAG TPA: CDP-diacylglycerol--serine O-phosphatidyltransferase [Polyangiaceae bacterium]|nr:CDP-diacylglycerol--serine O-phosphatidyltransferase [Polyangiaceae bacterium]